MDDVCYETDEISGLVTAQRYDVQISDPRTGNFSLFAADLATLDRFNLRVHVEHWGLGNYQAAWSKVQLGDIGEIRCRLVKVNNGREAANCYPRLYWN